MSILEWKISDDLIDYGEAITFMEKRVESIISGKAKELVWLLTHDDIYTAGSLAKESDLIYSNFKVVNTNRGGQYTYHGPGQRIIYLMLDLKQRSLQDIRKYIRMLEDTVIKTLEEFNIKGERREGRVGIWITRDFKEYKIAAIGVRVRKWVTMHGIAININPNLENYNGIVPCGIREHGVTSLKDLGVKSNFQDFDKIYQENFLKVFKDQKISLI